MLKARMDETKKRAASNQPRQPPAPSTKKTRMKGPQRGRGRKRLRVDDGELSDGDDAILTKRQKTQEDGQDQSHEASDDRGSAKFQQPALVTGARLKDYQLEGVEWMISLDQNGISGILGKRVYGTRVIFL
jgi:ATP-dependent DNA helicase